MSTVLICDDNADAADGMALLLEMDKHTVTTTYDPFAALDAFKQHRHRTVILDIGLPVMTGYDLAREIKKIDPTVTLIAVTGWGQQRDIDQAREAGFDHHFTKPAPYSHIRALVENRCLIKDERESWLSGQSEPLYE